MTHAFEWEDPPGPRLSAMTETVEAIRRKCSAEPGRWLRVTFSNRTAVYRARNRVRNLGEGYEVRVNGKNLHVRRWAEESG